MQEDTFKEIYAKFFPHGSKTIIYPKYTYKVLLKDFILKPVILFSRCVFIRSPRLQGLRRQQKRLHQLQGKKEPVYSTKQNCLIPTKSLRIA